MRANRSTFSAIACTALVAVFPAISGAQVATSLLNEGDPMPAAGAGHTVQYINNTAVNGVGGYSATLSTTDGTTTLSHAWGNPTGGPGAIIRTEGLVGIYDQLSWESFFGMDDLGQISYSPSCTDTVSGATGLDCVFVDGTPFAVEGLPIASLPGKEFRFASRPGITNNGMPYWVSGIDDIATGASEGNGLFTPAGVLIKTGDVIAGLPAPLGPNAADFDARFSAQGGHYIIGTTTTAATTADFFVLLDGAPIPSGAGILGEGQPVPVAAGGIGGENWDNFDFMGVNENGDYMVTGDTDYTGFDEFVAFNGTIIHREGDVLDGETLTGSIDGAFMNEAGDIAFIWDIVDATAGSLEALYLNDKLILKEGDAVDLYGQDGYVEATSILADFTGITALTMGPQLNIYFTADIDVNGTPTSSSDDIEGFFCIGIGNWTDLGNGLAGTGGITPILSGSGTLQAGAPATISLSNALPGSSAWLILGLAQINMSFRGGVMVPSMDVIFPGLPVSGTGDLVLATAWPPVPSGTPIYFQYWVVDAAGPYGASASNGLVGTTP